MQIRPYSGPAEKVRCINCLHYNDKRKPFGCKYSGARISLKAAKTRDIFCDYFIDERSVVGAARAGWRGHAVGIQGKKGAKKKPIQAKRARHVTYREALSWFRMNEARRMDPRDRPAIREAWVYYVDHLERTGNISQRQAETWDNPF